MMDYDVSLYDLVKLVVSFETSPRSSKTESGCKRYRSFGVGVSAVFCTSGSTARHPVVPRNRDQLLVLGAF